MTTIWQLPRGTNGNIVQKCHTEYEFKINKSFFFLKKLHAHRALLFTPQFGLRLRDKLREAINL